jgi:hypothetical protein
MDRRANADEAENVLDARRIGAADGVGAPSRADEQPTETVAEVRMAETRRLPVTDVYHGVEVPDENRWLEDDENPEVQAWSEAQNAHTRIYPDAIPFPQAIRNRIRELYSDELVAYWAPASRPAGIIVGKFQPPRSQGFTVTT